MAAGGKHYDIGSENQAVNFCPLNDIHEPAERQWAVGWIETCCRLEGMNKLTPQQRNAVDDGLKDLVESDTRSLTEFCAAVQDFDVREAMKGYLIDGRFGELLDANSSTISYSDFNLSLIHI